MRTIIGAVALVIAAIGFAACGGEQQADQSEPTPVRASVSSSTTVPPSSEMFPAFRLSENGDLELSIRFHQQRGGAEIDRVLAGRVSADRLEEGKCFQSKGVTRRDGWATAFVSVIACVEDGGKIKIGLRARRANEYGDKGDRYILASVPVERQRSGPWFVSPKGKTASALLPPAPAPRATPASPSRSAWTATRCANEASSLAGSFRSIGADGQRIVNATYAVRTEATYG